MLRCLFAFIELGSIKMLSFIVIFKYHDNQNYTETNAELMNLHRK